MPRVPILYVILNTMTVPLIHGRGRQREFERKLDRKFLLAKRSTVECDGYQVFSMEGNGVAGN